MKPVLPINLADLLDCRTVESERVEFKRFWDVKTTGSQVLRTICAFANDIHNLNGGYVIIGIEEARWQGLCCRPQAWRRRQRRRRRSGFAETAGVSTLTTSRCCLGNGWRTS